jgi:hypothetical protein
VCTSIFVIPKGKKVDHIYIYISVVCIKEIKCKNIAYIASLFHKLKYHYFNYPLLIKINSLYYKKYIDSCSFHWNDALDTFDVTFTFLNFSP